MHDDKMIDFRSDHLNYVKIVARKDIGFLLLLTQAPVQCMSVTGVAVIWI